MNIRIVTILIYPLFFVLMVPTALTEPMTTVTPVPLTNPGNGVARFHNDYGEKRDVADYPYRH